MKNIAENISNVNSKIEKDINLAFEAILGEKSKKVQEKTNVNTRYLQSHFEKLKFHKTKADRNKGSILYEWSEHDNIWQIVDIQNLEDEIGNWLFKNEPMFYNEKNIESIINSIKTQSPLIPQQPTKNIIPLKNAWLEIEEDTARIMCIQPSKELFIDYFINIELQDFEIGKEYHPKELPQNSIFKNYIESSQPDSKVREIIQEYLGYTLIPDTHYQTCQFWQGSGSNGKSVLMKLMQAIHPKNTDMELERLEPKDLIKLYGKSLAIVPECTKGKFDESIFKKVITEDTITVKSVYKDPISYVPTAKWIISCNDFPTISDSTNAFWRRIHLIKWKEQFGTGLNCKPINRNLEKDIKSNEMHIFLDWMLIGLKRLTERKEFDTSAIDSDKREQKIVNNSALNFFFNRELEVDYEASPDQYSMTKGYVYNEYVEYCISNGFKQMTSETFWKVLKNDIKDLKDVRRRTSNIKREYYVNLKYKNFFVETNETPFDK